MNKFKDKILKKIENGEVKKKSLFYFLVKNYFFWVMFLLSILIGSIAVSFFAINFVLDSGPWHRLTLSDDNFYYIFKIFPFIWFFTIILFILSSWFNFKNTKKSYKKNNFFIISFSIILSFVFGFILIFTGFGRKIEHKIKHLLPGYEKYLNEKMEFKKKFLEDRGINVDEFIKNHKLKHCKKNKCKLKVKSKIIWTK